MWFGCKSQVNHQRRFHGATDLGRQAGEPVLQYLPPLVDARRVDSFDLAC